MRTFLHLSKIKIYTTVLNRSLVLLLSSSIVVLCFGNAFASGTKGKLHKASPAHSAKIKPFFLPGRHINLLTAPTVSYTGTPQVYMAGTAITPVTPTSSGVAAPGLNATPANLGSFSYPTGVAVDASGNVFVADPGTNQIKKISGGTITVVASGFSTPFGVSLDNAGFMYVADQNNNQIKKIPVGGGAAQVIGSGFSLPTNTAVDAAGNVYVADYGNNAIKEIPVGGGLPVTIGSGFNRPVGIALDAAGNIYVADNGNNAIKKIAAGTGTITTIGSGYSHPYAVVVDSQGNVFVADNFNNAVKEIPAGSNTPIVLDSGFANPEGITLDAGGNIYIADSGTTSVKEIGLVGGFYISPGLPAGLSFNATTGVISGTPVVASPATNYLVTAYNSSGSATANISIQTKALTLSYTTPQTFFDGTIIAPVTPTATAVASPAYGSATTVTSGLNAPGGVAIDASGNIYFADAGNNAIKKIPAGGGAPVAIGSGFSSPKAVAVDASGNVYVADYGNNAIKKIPGGSGTPVSLVTGTNPIAVTVDAAGNVYYILNNNRAIYDLRVSASSAVVISQAFDNPVALASDAAGNLYIADAGVSEVVKLPFGGGLPGYVATISNPSGIGVDASGNVFVSGHGTNSVYMITPGNSTPILVSSSFAYPTGVAADNYGNVYAADNTGNDLLKITPAGGYFINNILPAGLLFNTTTGTLSGRPTVNTTAANFTITAYNTYGSNSAVVNITVNLPPAPTLSYTSPQTYLLNQAVTTSPTATNVTTAAYGRGTTTLGSGFSSPQAVAVDPAGNIYVADYGNSAIKKMPVGGGSPTQLTLVAAPEGVAVDAAGNVYYSSFTNNTVTKIPFGGGSAVNIGSGYNGPCGLAVDGNGFVYVADFNDNLVYKVPANGGTPVSIGSGFNHPNAVAVDAAGNVYVADVFNSSIKEIPVGGGSTFTISSSFLDPYGVAVDPVGNIFVADRNANAVFEIPAGTTSPFTIGSGFLFDYGVATDGAGNVYVADYSNNAIKEIKPTGGFYINTGLPAGLTFNNTSGTVSGTPTATSAATNYTVTAYNPAGHVAATVNLAVTVDATLSSLKISNGTLSPAFAPATIGYSASVVNTITSITLTPTVNDPAATVSVGGAPVTSGSASGAIMLSVGANAIPVVVTGSDHTTTKTYTVTVTRGPSTNALLGSISTTPTATLVGTTGSGYLNFNASVPNTVTSIQVTPTAKDPTATIKVNGTAVTSGTLSQAIALAVGQTVITTVITAQDGVTTKTVIITVTRAAAANVTLSKLSMSVGTLSPAFTSANISYTSNFANTVASVAVTPTATDPASTIKVNGTAVTSGTASQAIALNVGPNAIIIVVTGSDNVTTKTYTITITRAPSNNALLQSIATTPAVTLVGTSGSGYLNFNATIPNATASIKITPTAKDPTATIKVNGVTVASGTASQSIALPVGLTVITTVITAQDGTTTKTIIINATRLPSNNALLQSIATSPVVTLVGTTGSGYLNFNATVPNTFSIIQVIPTAKDPSATIKVNGITVTSGAASQSISLAVGVTVITTVITAQDGVTTKTIIINVTRKPSSTATLSHLTISAGTLSPVFAAATTSYTASVAGTVSSVTVTPTLTDVTGTVKVNGTTVNSGTASAAIPLAIGPNAITTVVTAQDGTTTKSYTVTITRVPSTNALLQSIATLPATSLLSTTGTGYLNFNASVPNSISSIQVVPTAKDATATITVNGMAVTSGTASQAIALPVGSTMITTVITAQDGVTTRTITINVTRAMQGANAFYVPQISVTKPGDQVSLEDGIAVHEALSPNGDGINDYLTIDGIASYPQNKLTIVDRNGMLVYQAQGYDNSSKIFDGHSNGGKMQLPGTYFYSLDYMVNGESRHKTGYILLKY